MDKHEIRRRVTEKYGEIAAGKTCGCGCAPGCCGQETQAKSQSLGIGYSKEDLLSVPDGANLGLGCGNPVAIASLKEGETVLDLGSGAGFDCFLAARRVGESGRVIGVEMTPQMLEKARKNVESGSYANVEFRLGEIEHLPVADSSVDVIISNCVINLSPDKPAVFSEAYRVLRPGGRIMVSDIVITRDLPDPVKRLADAYTGCISGASRRDAYLDCITSAGFLDIAILDEKTFPIDFITSDPEIRGLSPDLLEGLKESVKSIRVRAIKPR